MHAAARLCTASLRAQGLSWKQCQKGLKKADSQCRAAFVQPWQALFARVCRQEIRLIYLDEAHLHRDMDVGARGQTRLASERLCFVS